MSTARRIAIAACWLGLAPSAALGRDEALTPGDFAWGRAVETTSGDPLQTLLLDLPIYRGAVGPELADLRVFNGAGEVVPHAIRALVDPRAEQGAPLEVPFFRLPGAAALAAGEGGERKAERRTALARDVAIELSGDGAIVRVGPGVAPGDSGAAGGPPQAYLIDLSQLERNRAVVGLDLELAALPQEFVVPVRVEASDDLVHFDTLRTREALARLDQAGHRIERSQVELSGVAHRYLLLTSAGQPLPVEVRSVRVRVAPELALPPRQRERIAGERVAGECCAFIFDLGGPIPVDRVQFDFPVQNTVVEAEVLSSSEPVGPWLRHFSGVLYQLDRSGTLRNAELPLPPIRQRYLKLVVAPKGGGVGGGAPVLEIAWRPEQLVFVSRGVGPFAVGYGRAQVEDARFEASALIRTALSRDEEVPRATASLGPVVPVGDPAVLLPRSEPPSRRTLALWAVLIASVGGVLVLSVRLLRRMGRPEDGVPS